MGPTSLGTSATSREAQSGVTGLVLDAGGLIALERRDRRAYLLMEQVFREKATVVVPATALSQVLRDPSRQVPLVRLLQLQQTEVVPLDRRHAKEVGLLLARSGRSDIADAHVIVCAQERSFPILTSDPNDLARLDPSAELVLL